jgi:hypothetical protein
VQLLELINDVYIGLKNELQAVKLLSWLQFLRGGSLTAGHALMFLDKLRISLNI